MRPNKAKRMLVASFYADSYAMPFHFIDDREALATALPDSRKLVSPKGNAHHGHKQAGELTHIGDQSLLMYELLQREAGFTVEVARKHWCSYMQSYQGFMDEATTTSLKTYTRTPHALKGSDCDSLAGAARIAPFIYCFDDPATLLIAVEAQTRLTHSHPTVVAAALFLTKLAYRVKHGQDVVAAINAESASLPSTSPLAPLIDAAQQGTELTAPEALVSLGTDSKVDSAFAATMLLIFRFQNNFWQALEQNVLAGGDSATRGALSGMILGASLDRLPEAFCQLSCYSQIMRGAPLVRAH